MQLTNLRCKRSIMAAGAYVLEPIWWKGDQRLESSQLQECIDRHKAD
jgi:hypothetical protein